MDFGEQKYVKNQETTKSEVLAKRVQLKNPKKKKKQIPEQSEAILLVWSNHCVENTKTLQFCSKLIKKAPKPSQELILHCSK